MVAASTFMSKLVVELIRFKSLVDFLLILGEGSTKALSSQFLQE